ncbi:MAG TPA: SDR family oxidoreductase [Acidimicrobiales bacterium]|nr:SDR family oxidoreductase [Acidimicrobiales bacterium]
MITGGSGSIGLACGVELLRRGFKVVLTARSEDKLAAAAAEIGASHVAADSTDEHSFAAVMDAVDHVDVLVHSAGMLGGTFVRKEEPEVWDEVLRSNLRSAFVATWATVKKMPPGGRFIYISSTAAADPMKGLTAYSAGKAGVDAFAKSLAKEVARDGIQVHIVSPGPVLTPMISEPKFLMHVIRSEDVAQLVGFLTSLRPEVCMPEIRFWGAEEGPFESETIDRPPKA